MKNINMRKVAFKVCDQISNQEVYFFGQDKEKNDWIVSDVTDKEFTLKNSNDSSIRAALDINNIGKYFFRMRLKIHNATFKCGGLYTSCIISKDTYGIIDGLDNLLYFITEVKEAIYSLEHATSIHKYLSNIIEDLKTDVSLEEKKTRRNLLPKI